MLIVLETYIVMLAIFKLTFNFIGLKDKSLDAFISMTDLVELLIIGYCIFLEPCLMFFQKK